MTTISVAEFLSIANQKFSSPNKWYSLTGDVSNHKFIHQFHYYDLTDESDSSVSVRIRIDGTDLPSDKENPLKNRKVKAVGWMNRDFKTASLYLKVKSGGITDLGESTCCKKLKTWKAKYEKDFERPEVQREYPRLAPNFRNVGLIYGEHSKAYDDFKTIIRAQPSIRIHEKPVEIKDIEKIAEVICKLNTERKCDCICIIRGGGSEEDMRLYSEETLLEAMRDSKLPIITGIGHATDEPLCQSLARYPAITPTDAAYFFLKVARHYEELREIEASSHSIGNQLHVDPATCEARFHELKQTPRKTLEQEREMAGLRELLKKLQKSGFI